MIMLSIVERCFWNHVSHEVAKVLDVAILENKLEKMISHLTNDKHPRWNGFRNELFKKYLI